MLYTFYVTHCWHCVRALPQPRRGPKEIRRNETSTSTTFVPAAHPARPLTQNPSCSFGYSLLRSHPSVWLALLISTFGLYQHAMANIPSSSSQKFDKTKDTNSSLPASNNGAISISAHLSLPIFHRSRYIMDGRMHIFFYFLFYNWL